MSTGRNDPCPCGSGKKYKKCCLYKSKLILNGNERQEFDELRRCFEKYDQADLISFLAFLQVCPENHTHLLRLETATRVACSFVSNGRDKVIPHIVIAELNQYLSPSSPIGIMEDPAENPFTENLVFYGGNFIIYPGTAHGESFTLRTLFDTIYQSGTSISPLFEHIVATTAICILSLGNEIAKRLGHNRNMSSPDKWREELQVPQEVLDNPLYSAVSFSNDEINTFLTPFNYDYRFFDPFITVISEQNLNNERLDKNPLLLRPIVDIKNRKIVALPCSLITALRHRIWSLAQKHDILSQLAKAYRGTLWNHVKEWMRFMDHKEVDAELPLLNKPLPIIEGIFNIDADKIAYVQLVTDDGSKYSNNDAFDTWDQKDLSERTDNRRDEIGKWLMNLKSPIYRQSLFITVIGGIGRYIFIALNNQPPQTRTLIMNGDDLETIAKSRELDSLSLWKYAGAIDNLEKRTRLNITSFLDGYGCYLNYRHSFYMSDDEKPNLISLVPGFGTHLRIKTKQEWDAHGSLYGNPPAFVAVCRCSQDIDIPIYIPEAGIGKVFDQLIEGYTQPLWVDSEIKPWNLTHDIRIIYLQFTDMLAYWLWQLTPNLYSHLVPLGSAPIHITFNLEDYKSWSDSSNSCLNLIKSEPALSHKINGQNIYLLIPKAIQAYLSDIDNQGERLILNELMKAFNDLLANSGKPPTLSDIERQRILDIHAPLGRKKKLYMIDPTLDSALLPNNLPRYRELLEHNIEEELEDLVEALGEETPPVGVVIKSEDRTKLCNKIVQIFTNRLKASLKELSGEKLLDILICQYEAILHRQANLKIDTPSSIECYYDVQTKVDKLTKELPLLEATMLALRTLIEIVAAEPPTGSEEPSTDVIDKILAITHHLVRWGIVSDHIYLETVNHNISILKSGRIGVQSEIIKDAWEPFLKTRTLEKVEVDIDKYPDYFIKEDETTTDDKVIAELDKAFIPEFGFTTTQVAEFHRALTILGFELNLPAPHLPLSQLITNLINKLEWSPDVIEKIIDLHTLRPRDNWERAPDGFNDREDIWPWRFNRRLSYLRRPLIIWPDPNDDQIVFWGPRHTDQAGKNILGLVANGHYKCHPNSSREMRILQARIHDKIGNSFVTDIYDWFKNNTDWPCYSKVHIGPNQKLNASYDLGDIDILAINPHSKIIYSIECKKIFGGRNPREIAAEINELLKDKEGGKSLTEKHLQRDKWIKNNLDQVLCFLKTELKTPKIISLFLTSEEISAPYIRKMPLPFISYSRLKRERVACFENLI